VTDSYDDEPSGYGSACSVDRDCQHTTTHLECLHGTCVCLQGYVPLGKYLCYNIRGQGNKFEEIYTIIGIYFKVHRLYKVQLSYLLYSVKHQHFNQYIIK